MKIVVLHGSPRKGKNSDTLADSFLEGVKKTAGHSVEHFYLNEMTIRPCQGCMSCETTGVCVNNDDMQLIYKAFRDSQVIVFATPMYWGYLTAQMKIAVDRLEAVAGAPFHGKIFVVLITHRYHYESAVAFFERICPYFKVEFYTLAVCTIDSATGDDITIEELPDDLRRSRELGEYLGKKVIG